MSLTFRKECRQSLIRKSDNITGELWTKLVTSCAYNAIAMAHETSSTEQDLARGKPTEIDSLNGYVSRRGSELGIPTPLNSTLHALVKLLEAEHQVRFRRARPRPAPINNDPATAFKTFSKRGFLRADNVRPASWP